MPRQRESVDITVHEKQEIDAMPQREAINSLDASYDQISEIKSEKKADPHLTELRNQVKEINGDYRERVEVATAKSHYLVAHLKRINS